METFFRKARDRYDATYMTFVAEALNAKTTREVLRRILEGSVAVQTLDGASRVAYVSTAPWPAPTRARRSARS
jgi:hypothetical protein